MSIVRIKRFPVAYANYAIYGHDTNLLKYQAEQARELLSRYGLKAGMGLMPNDCYFGRSVVNTTVFLVDMEFDTEKDGCYDIYGEPYHQPRYNENDVKELRLSGAALQC
jgi:hypothetical protein